MRAPLHAALPLCMPLPVPSYTQRAELHKRPNCAACNATEGLAPVDLLLLMAAKENDAPKVAELLRAGAKLDVKVGRLAGLSSCGSRLWASHVHRTYDICWPFELCCVD